MPSFEAGRRGSTWHHRSRHRTEPLPRWQTRATTLLATRWSGGAIVLLSATVGLPPLALVSAAAGLARARRVDFLLCCLLGRTTRFVTVAAIVLVAWRS